jgi:hypothetical protein
MKAARGLLLLATVIVVACGVAEEKDTVAENASAVRPVSYPYCDYNDQVTLINDICECFALPPGVAIEPGPAFCYEFHGYKNTQCAQVGLVRPEAYCYQFGDRVGVTVGDARKCREDADCQLLAWEGPGCTAVPNEVAQSCDPSICTAQWQASCETMKTTFGMEARCIDRQCRVYFP